MECQCDRKKDSQTDQWEISCDPKQVLNVFNWFLRVQKKVGRASNST